MNVTFRQLRLFAALADTGSVSAAARVMHVTQPTASMQLRELGAAVGMPLFEVVARRVHLTEAGGELAQAARTMLGEWESFGQRVHALRGLERGRLAVAVVSTAKYFIPRLLGAFCAEHPEIEVALEVLNRDGVVQRLRENRDDLYVMSMPPAGPALEERAFLPNPLVLVAPAAHPLARRRGLALADLREERFVLREAGSGTRLAADAHFRRTRFKPQVRLQLGSNEAVKASVAGGLGVGVLSRHALDPDPARDGVALLDVQGFPIRSQWYVVRHKGKRLSPAAESFQRHLLAAAATFSADARAAAPALPAARARAAAAGDPRA